MRNALLNMLRRFRDDTRGSVMMELIFAALLTNMVLAAFYVWWDAYQAQARVEKTAYTISDLISRQRATQLSRPLLDGMERTAEFLLMDDQNARLRISHVFRRTGAADSLSSYEIWSYSPCGAMPPITQDPDFRASSIPLLAVGSAIVIVELVVPFEPEYAIGISPTTFTRRVMAMPRFVETFGTQPTGIGTTTCIN